LIFLIANCNSSVAIKKTHKSHFLYRKNPDKLICFVILLCLQDVIMKNFKTYKCPGGFL